MRGPWFSLSVAGKNNCDRLEVFKIQDRDIGDGPCNEQRNIIILTLTLTYSVDKLHEVINKPDNEESPLGYASLLIERPATSVILASIAYIKVVAVKKLVVEP